MGRLTKRFLDWFWSRVWALTALIYLAIIVYAAFEKGVPYAVQVVAGTWMALLFIALLVD